MSALVGRPPAVAIVVNPSKFDDLERTQVEVAALVRQSGWATPVWFETTREDPGVAATRMALEQTPDLVCAMGGDGTVSAVASVLRGTHVPYGLLPSGTGNLLARNLGIPLDSLEDALEIAMRGQDRAIDIGLATFDDGIERVFVVMGGVGLDAEIMAQTDAGLKKRVGWGAYVVASRASLIGGGFEAALTIDGASLPSQSCLMVLACNCSSVVANIELARGAMVSDGMMALVMLRPNGVTGWVSVAIDLAAHIRNGITSLHQWSGQDMRFQLDRPVLAEIDGDPVGPTRSGRFGVDPAALIVRLPVPAKRTSGLGSRPRALDEEAESPLPSEFPVPVPIDPTES
jgi:diacylglycerol kinase (ATP)